MKRLCMALIRFYQRTLSRLKPYPTCRFTPTCSQYALEAFEKRGFFAGLVLTLWRILRCSPLSPCGYDPVPEKGFRTMPLRWSKYDRPQEADNPPDAGTDPPGEDVPGGGKTSSGEASSREAGPPDAPADAIASDEVEARPNEAHLDRAGEDADRKETGKQRPKQEEPHP